ncbi:MAG: response regulator [Sandaracinaceae bacterium]|nr:response regulator [Sandaracinaceae bacterium]
MSQAGPLVLLVEDSRADALLLRRELLAHRPNTRLHVVTDSDAALEFLRGDAEPLPGLVILDLKLPKRDGRELLGDLKADATLRHIPVVVLTSSALPGDVDRCYELHANAYVSKPMGLSELRKTVQSISHFWLDTALLPGGPR